jgi:hypothetical protein
MNYLLIPFVVALYVIMASNSVTCASSFVTLDPSSNNQNLRVTHRLVSRVQFATGVGNYSPSEDLSYRFWKLVHTELLMDHMENSIFIWRRFLCSKFYFVSDILELARISTKNHSHNIWPPNQTYIVLKRRVYSTHLNEQKVPVSICPETSACCDLYSRCSMWSPCISTQLSALRLTEVRTLSKIPVCFHSNLLPVTAILQSHWSALNTPKSAGVPTNKNPGD